MPQKESKFCNITILKETRARLKKFKLIDQDTHDNVINRALDKLEKEQND